MIAAVGKPVARGKTSLRTVSKWPLAALVVAVAACGPALNPGTEADPLAAEIRVGDATAAGENSVGASPVSPEELRQAAREVGPDMLRRWREFWRPKASELPFDLDRQVERVTRPEGVTIDPACDPGGRLLTVKDARGNLTC